MRRIPISAVLVIVLTSCGPEPVPFVPAPVPFEPRIEAIAHVDSVRALGAGRWVRCFQGPDGAIYLRNRWISRDGGRTIEHQDHVDVEPLNIRPERVVRVTDELVFGAAGRAVRVGDGRFRLHTYRSTDGLATLDADTAIVIVPDGPDREPEGGEWFGLFVFGNVVDATDGAWLMTMYGNFATDTVAPTDASAASETVVAQRSFLVRSTDQGRTWTYHATIAAPDPQHPLGEGFVEPTMARLPDGRLLAVLRTGHHFPLHVTWSDDDGRTWTTPRPTPLDGACDPTLIVLRDDRLALVWGQRYNEAMRYETWKYPGKGTVNLALSEDAGVTWQNQPLVRNAGSCYAMAIEVEPDVLFFQVDQWVWHVELEP